jgi:CspA family cold shock protein
MVCTVRPDVPLSGAAGINRASRRQRARGEEWIMVEGTVKWYNEKKQYGFIESQGIEDIFFHGTSIVDHGFFGLTKDDRVSFEVRQTDRGRQAFQVKVLR